MKFALFASGSKGNCCLIKHGTTKIVIDCGSTKKYLLNCFERVNVNHKEVDALLITHTHKDHVAQINMFQGVSVYGVQDMNTEKFNSIAAYDSFMIEDIKVTVLPLSHDCDNTVGYVLETEEEKLVYITDTGYIKEEVKEYLYNADYYIFESNHDIEMLMQTNRPIFLKQRIINDYGHLCNEDCANILAGLIGDRTKEIVLAHISQEGNTRGLALHTLKEVFTRRGIDCQKLRMYPAAQFEIYIGGNQE